MSAPSDCTSHVPRETGRNAKLALLDAWLLLNTERLVNESPKAIAQELRSLGHFSKATGLGDIRLSFHRRCRKLGIPFSRP